ncbi:MAG: glycosyltransferase [Acidimicrobiia bacterium]|nr:glycosyltransferase [Acidimicrobiia bacterium]
MTPLARRSRVLHLATRYRRGGSEQRIRDLVAALPDADHVIVVGDDSDPALAASQLTVPIEVEPTLVRAPNPVQDIRAVAAIRERVRQFGPDVIVTHQSKAGVVGRLAARLTGRIPVVHSLSMANFGPGYGRVESVAFRTIERILAPITARYVVVGADLARRFEVAGVASDKLTIVRSAATLPAERPSVVPPVPRVPEGRPVIVSLGALEDRKHPLDLLPLLAQVQESVPDAFLAIAGDGPLRDALHAAVSDASLDDSVAVLGYVSPTEPLVWRADVVVLLSDAEGLPQVLIQAAAAGIPFVSYDVDGAREVIGLGADGEVVDLGDVQEAAAGVVRALRAGTAGVRRVDVSSWNPAVIHERYRSVVDEVVAEARRAG